MHTETINMNTNKKNTESQPSILLYDITISLQT